MWWYCTSIYYLRLLPRQHAESHGGGTCMLDTRRVFSQGLMKAWGFELNGKSLQGTLVGIAYGLSQITKPLRIVSNCHDKQ